MSSHLLSDIVQNMGIWPEPHSHSIPIPDWYRNDLGVGMMEKNVAHGTEVSRLSCWYL